jgi:hypothetical protein
VADTLHEPAGSEGSESVGRRTETANTLPPDAERYVSNAMKRRGKTREEAETEWLDLKATQKRRRETFRAVDPRLILEKEWPYEGSHEPVQKKKPGGEPLRSESSDTDRKNSQP